MQEHATPGSKIFRLVIACLGIILLSGSGLIAPNSIRWDISLAATFFIAFIFNYPLRILNLKITLLQVISLGGSLLYGPIPMAWSVAAGILLGQFVWDKRNKRSSKPAFQASWWVDTGFIIGSNLLPLCIFFFVEKWENGISIHLVDPRNAWLSIILLCLLFSLIHGLLFISSRFFNPPISSVSKFRDYLSLVLVEVTPIPLILFIIEGFPIYGDKAIFAIGILAIITGFLINTLDTTRLAKERKIQELAILDRVSQTLQSTLDLEELLPVIQNQVQQIFKLDNFYVALYDEYKKDIWYPLAVKNGIRYFWDRRPIENRLTDRVISEGKPIFFTPKTQSGPNPIGMPPSEDTPASWLGIPLIASERTIGCLAVSELTTGIEFASDDIDLLTILSAQVSVAIDNALLFEQAERRAYQLETLNQLTSSITASLNPDEVLKQVCHSVTLVGGANRSAIYLLEPGEFTVQLSFSQGLSEAYLNNHRRNSIVQDHRTRCLRTGRPFVVADIHSSSLPEDQIKFFQDEYILAFADFPLVAPDGEVGFLSVFYDEAHVFNQEEIHLLQTFASHAALAVTNARIYAVTGEQLSRRLHQLAILEAVGRELSAAIHSDELFKLILDYALEFTNSICGYVAIYNPENQRLELKAHIGYEKILEDMSIKDSIAGDAVIQKTTINIGDIKQDPRYATHFRSDTQSQLYVPIMMEMRVLGVITLESSESNAFQENELSLTRQLANQAAIAIINADLYNETQRRLREQSTLYLVSKKLVGVLDLEEVIATLVSALNAVQESKILGIYLWHPDHKYFELCNSSEQTVEHVNRFPIHLTESELQTLGISGGQTGHLYISSNSPGARNFLGENESNQVFCVSFGSGFQLLGFVVFQWAADQKVQENEVNLLEAIITQGSIAIQNSRLYADATNQRDRLNAIINSVKEGIILVDTGGDILWANEPIQIITGVPINELYHSRLAELPSTALDAINFKKEDIYFLLKEAGKVQVLPTQKIEYQVPNRLPTMVLERDISPVLGQDGKVVGWIILLRDKTEEFETNQAREIITQTLVHDLRSPMSAVVGAMDVIETTLDVDDRDDIIRQSLRVAKGGAKRVLDLVEGLLEIARLESAQVELVFMPVRLASIIAELIPDFTVLANESGIILINDVPTNLPTIAVDQAKITRVIMNLLDNAVKFTPEGGRVRISASYQSNQTILVEVDDTGSGIPSEYHKKIFERFSQVPGTRPRRRGSGLGLAFCKLVVEAHGGEIWVESEPGKGSIVKFTIPIKDLEQSWA